MAALDVDEEMILEELRKFYRGARVSLEKSASEMMFLVDSYRIRNLQRTRECRVAIRIAQSGKEVLVESGCEDLNGLLVGEVKRLTVAGAEWLIIPVSSVWEYGRPSYWFLERNLTNFFTPSGK